MVSLMARPNRRTRHSKKARTAPKRPFWLGFGSATALWGVVAVVQWDVSRIPPAHAAVRPTAPVEVEVAPPIADVEVVAASSKAPSDIDFTTPLKVGAATVARHAARVAPVAPEAEAQPATVVAKAPPERPSLIEGKVARNQFIADVLTRAGVTAVEADLLVRSLRGVYDFRNSRPGHAYRIELNDAGAIAKFEYQAGVTEIYDVVREGEALKGKLRDIELDRQVVRVDGKVKSSLYDAFVDAGESPNLAMALSDAFQYDIDFFHHTRSGDEFRLFVEKFTYGGKLVRYGRVMAAEYKGVASGPVGTKRLYWYDNGKTGTQGFYDAKGKAARRAFLRSPLKYSRISSGFGYRYHPILKKKHFHGGVDYAAPRGTQVQAVADGKVTFAARKGPAGNMVRVRHVDGYESYYLHLSKISVRVGQRVTQSTLVGLVGSTGRSTGPHLDFRLKRHGKYLNPTKHVVPRKQAIAGKDRAPFDSTVARWKLRLDGEAQLASR